MTTYNVKYTNSSKTPITVDEKEINTSLSVNFPGRIRLEWGETVNENLMRLLENFAVRSSGADVDTPDAATSGAILNVPIEGQLWFNKTNNRLYSFDGADWRPYAERGQQYAANYGQIRHGQQLPLPVSPGGYNFDYDECIWAVSPFSYFTGFRNVQCNNDSINSTVTMTYTNSLFETIQGTANYLIIGIQRNENLGNSVF